MSRREVTQSIYNKGAICDETNHICWIHSTQALYFLITGSTFGHLNITFFISNEQYIHFIYIIGAKDSIWSTERKEEKKQHVCEEQTKLCVRPL